jgi:hypothetical protein
MSADPTPSHVSAAREGLLVAGLAVAATLILARPLELSPDSYELLATIRCWAGAGPCSGPTSWPPLWPALLTPFALVSLERAAWIVNLLLCGAVALPLYSSTRRLAGPWAARTAVLVWVLLPAVHHNVAVIDARPAMWLLSAGCFALALRAAADDGAWWPAFVLAALAPLVRDEGLAMPVLVSAAALLSGQAWRRVLPAMIASAAPWLIWTAFSGAERAGYEAYGVLWQGIWDEQDLLALLGPPTAATPFREFLIRATEAGLEDPGFQPLAMLQFLPRGLALLGRALAGSIGLLGLAGLSLGLLRLWRRGWRVRLMALLAASPMLALAAVPMPWSNGSPATNIVFLLPWLLTLCLAGWYHLLPRRRKRLLPLLVLPLMLELSIAPWQLSAPTFVEDSSAAVRMTRWLAAHPPPGGEVVCSYAGRSVVRRAGLVPIQLPSAWDIPVPKLPVLISEDFLNDGGRGLELLEDPSREAAAWTGPQYPRLGESGDWYLYLEPADAP